MSNYNSEKMIKHLNQKWGNKGCPMCGQNKWGVSDKLMELREFHGGSMVIGGNSSVQPVIPVNCGNCGYTVLVNGLLAGVIDRPTAEESGDE